MSLFGTKTIYFIDSENVNENWIDTITDLKKSDEIKVFYTEKSTNVSWENMSKIVGGDVNLNWIKCFTGQNALDFQLVTDLGYSVAKGSRDTFVIVSNDKGYDAVVNYWVIKGINVSRIGVEMESKSKAKKRASKAKTVAKTADKPKAAAKPKAVRKVAVDNKEKAKKAPTSTTPKSVWDKTPSSEMGYVEAVGRCISVKNHNHYHIVLTNLFGQEKGTEYYHQLKEDKELKDKIAKTYISRKPLRLDYIVRLFLVYNGKDFTDLADIIRIINSKKNDSLNAFYKLLTEKFKEEKGRAYYNIYKGIYKVLKDI